MDETDTWLRIMNTLPWNVVNFFEKDISSARLTPLLVEYLKSGKNETAKYIIIANIIRQKPSGWFGIVSGYMKSIHKNSFYLLSCFLELRDEYRFGFCSTKQRTEIEELFGIAIARHEFGSKSPSKKLIRKATEGVLKSISKPKSEND